METFPGNHFANSRESTRIGGTVTMGKGKVLWAVGCASTYLPLATLGIIHLLIADSPGMARPPLSSPVLPFSWAFPFRDRRKR